MSSKRTGRRTASRHSPKEAQETPYQSSSRATKTATLVPKKEKLQASSAAPSPPNPSNTRLLSHCHNLLEAVLEISHAVTSKLGILEQNEMAAGSLKLDVSHITAAMLMLEMWARGKCHRINEHQQLQTQSSTATDRMVIDNKEYDSESSSQDDILAAITTLTRVLQGHTKGNQDAQITAAPNCRQKTCRTSPLQTSNIDDAIAQLHFLVKPEKKFEISNDACQDETMQVKVKDASTCQGESAGVSNMQSEDAAASVLLFLKSASTGDLSLNDQNNDRSAIPKNDSGISLNHLANHQQPYHQMQDSYHASQEAPPKTVSGISTSSSSSTLANKKHKPVFHSAVFQSYQPPGPFIPRNLRGGPIQLFQSQKKLIWPGPLTIPARPISHGSTSPYSIQELCNQQQNFDINANNAPLNMPQESLHPIPVSLSSAHPIDNKICTLPNSIPRSSSMSKFNPSQQPPSNSNNSNTNSTCIKTHSTPGPTRRGRGKGRQRTVYPVRKPSTLQHSSTEGFLGLGVLGPDGVASVIRVGGMAGQGGRKWKYEDTVTSNAVPIVPGDGCTDVVMNHGASGSEGDVAKAG